VVTASIRHDEEAWLTEGLLDLIGEGARCEATGYGVGTGVVSKLEDGPLQNMHIVAEMLVEVPMEVNN